MIKLIFLDIDGVIATAESLQDGEWGLVDSKQKILSHLIANTGAKIVLSSSWRLSDVESTKIHLSNKGFICCESIIGVTIRAYQHVNKGVHLSIPRGVEIKQWLDANIHSSNGRDWRRKELGKDFNYVIIDDDSDMLLEQKDHFIRTDSETGLTEPLAYAASLILNNVKTS